MQSSPVVPAEKFVPSDEFDLDDQKQADMLGTFSIEELTREFETERQPGGGCSSHVHVATRREKRLQAIEKKFLDVRHMSAMAKPDYVLEFPNHATISRMTESLTFQYLYFFLVLLYSIVMGCELEFDDESNANLWFQVNCLFACAFSFEAFVKLYTYGHRYFFVRWYVLEFITVFGSLTTLAMYYRGYDDSYRQIFTCLKVSRTLLLGKLFSMREEFQVIVLGFTRSLTSLWGVFFVVLVVCYGCTLFCYSVIGKHEYPEEHEDWHDEYFGSIPKIMMTLFSMIIVDEWAGFARPVFMVQPIAVSFFFVFTVLTTLGLLNVVTGMVVDTVNSVSNDHDAVTKIKDQAKQREKLEELVELVFHAGDGHAITEAEFEFHDNTDELVDMVKTIDFPTSFTLKDLFCILDWPAHKEIYKEQFVDGVMHFIHSEQFQLDLQVMLSINKVSRDVMSMRKELRVVHHRTQRVLKTRAKKNKFKAVVAGAGVGVLDDVHDSGASRGDSSNARGDSSSFSDSSFWQKQLSPEDGERDRLLSELPEDGDADMTGHFGSFSIEELVGEFENEGYSRKSSSNLGMLRQASMQAKAKPPQIVDVDQLQDTFVTPRYIAKLPHHRALTRIVQSRRWKLGYGAAVSVFSIMMGAELTMDDEKYEDRWFYMNTLFTMLFSFEVFCKLYVYGHNYFRVPWFLLEFFTTFGSVFTLGLRWYGWSDDYENAFMCLKLSRIVLLGKLFSLRDEFEIIVLGFTRSLYNLWGIMFVLLVINYGCTLFCYAVIGKHDYSEYGADYDHELYWGSIPKTMITLFSMMITDNWGGYSRVVYEEQAPVIVFFYFYTIFLTMGLLNVVTGMVVDTVNDVKAESDKKKQDLLREQQKKELTDVVELVFQDSPNSITEADFINHASTGELMAILEIVDVPHHFTLKDFFTVLDQGGHKKMLKEHFVEGIVSLVNSTAFHRECQILLSVQQMRRSVVELRKELSTMHHRVKDYSKPPVLATAASKASLSSEGSSKTPESQKKEMEMQLKKEQEYTNERRLSEIEGMMMKQAHLQKPPTSTDLRMPEKRWKLRANGDHWEQLRAVIHDAAMEHCVEELKKAWDDLKYEHVHGDDNDKPVDIANLTPAMAASGSMAAILQEKWYVRHKLYSAVSRESLAELRLALDHAEIVGISERSSAILFTFCDVLARQHKHISMSSEQIVGALESSNWIQALDLVVDMALKHGADKTLLLQALARLCADSAGHAAWQPSPGFRLGENGELSVQQPRRSTGDFKGMSDADSSLLGKALKTATIDPQGGVDLRGRLVAVLHSEAAEHASRELAKAWDELDRAYKAAERKKSAKGGFGPGYSPFSSQEELFFIRNQISDAVRQESLLELRRALTHALSYGIDPQDIEIELAYRDALIKHQQGVAFSARFVIEALERGNWWSALDDIIGASVARGADRHTLLKMIAKVVSPTAHLYKTPAPRGNQREDSYNNGREGSYNNGFETEAGPYKAYTRFDGGYSMEGTYPVSLEPPNFKEEEWSATMEEI